jgi:hypothetical protein
MIEFLPRLPAARKSNVESGEFSAIADPPVAELLPPIVPKPTRRFLPSLHPSCCTPWPISRSPHVAEVNTMSACSPRLFSLQVISLDSATFMPPDLLRRF